MSKSLKLTVVAVLLVAAIALVVWDAQRSEIEQQVAELLLPELLDAVNDVTELSIVTASESFRIELEGGHWTIAEKFGYWADFDKVRNTLVWLTQARLAELVNEDPANHRQFGLSDPASPEFNGARIILKSKDSTVADVLVGSSRFGSSSSSASQYYARYPDRSQVWLVDVTLPELSPLASWLDRRIGEISRDEIQEVSIFHIDLPAIRVHRSSPNDNFSLDSDRPPRAQYLLNDIGGILHRLSFEDVVPTPNNIQWGTRFRVVTFEGLVLDGKISAGSRDELIEFSADDATGSTQSLKAMVDELNDNWRGWAYRLSDSRLRILNLTLEDLVEHP